MEINSQNVIVTLIVIGAFSAIYLLVKYGRGFLRFLEELEERENERNNKL